MSEYIRHQIHHPENTENNRFTNEQLNKVFSFNNPYLKPNVVIAKTIKGKGVSYMENEVKWHYKSPNTQELLIAIKEINNA